MKTPAAILDAMKNGATLTLGTKSIINPAPVAYIRRPGKGPRRITAVNPNAARVAVMSLDVCIERRATTVTVYRWCRR